MQLYTREETIRKINHLGQSCRPFIFIINYLQDASYIEEVASVDPSEVVYNLNGFTNQSSSKDVLSCFEEPVHWNSIPNLSIVTVGHLISFNGIYLPETAF